MFVVLVWSGLAGLASEGQPQRWAKVSAGVDAGVGAGVCFHLLRSGQCFVRSMQASN